jgi:hypothetical protein
LVDEKVRSPARARGTAVLDDAHVGDIRGALGTIREHERAGRRTWRQRLLALAAIIGPGLIVMVGDNDAGGVATYAQAGQDYGTSLLWTLVLLIPVLIVNQEMVVRLGAVTGVGHARLIFERFGRFWGLFSVADLFLLNFLTIVTEFIGAVCRRPHCRCAAGCDNRERPVRDVGTDDVRVHPWKPADHSIGGTEPSFMGTGAARPLRARHTRRHHLERGSADHRDRGNHRCSVAAVLPAVKRDRQAHHAALDRI